MARQPQVVKVLAENLTPPSTPNCNICRRALNVPDDDTTLDCGGDCLRCMADIGDDPDCIAAMDKLDPGWREKAKRGWR